MSTFGEKMKALMAQRGFSLRQLARIVPYDKGHLSKVCNDLRPPSEELAAILDEALGANGELVALRPSPPRRASRRVAAPTPIIRPDPGGRTIQALDVLTSSGSNQLGDVADKLEGLIAHYAVTICAQPPAGVYDELLAVRSYAGGILNDATPNAPQRPDLIVATGWLSNLLAIAASDMGELAAADVWCSDAESRSQEAGHPELAGWARLTRAMTAFYQGQPRRCVMLAAHGRELVPMNTVIHAKLAAQEMRAAAMAGDAVRMTHARTDAAKAIEKIPSDADTTGAFSIPIAEDPPYTATSLLLVGRFHDAVSATNRVIRTVYHQEARQRSEHPSGYARSLLILGLSQAGAGKLDEAVAAGQAALSGSRPAWPTMMLAGKLDQVLARDFGDSRQTADYHALYVEAADRVMTQRPQLPAPAEDR